jgi:hypothetical protein
LAAPETMLLAQCAHNTQNHRFGDVVDDKELECIRAESLRWVMSAMTPGNAYTVNSGLGCVDGRAASRSGSSAVQSAC